MLKKGLFISLIILIVSIIDINNSKSIINIQNKFGIKPQKNYVGQLIINKVGINNYIYDVNDKNNNVNSNVQLLKKSTFPVDNTNSSIFLAAHSGNSNISYFDNLDKLDKDDEIVFLYSNYKLTYKVKNIFTQIKDGTIEINQVFSNQLVLTTCDPNSNNLQLIIICDLDKKEKV